MNTPPERPKVYHITHKDNLSGIVADQVLLSDRRIMERGGPTQTIGMSNIKRRRLEVLEVSCHPGTKVGDYVPFNSCPRSVMLYVIHRGNNPQLAYQGGQEPILHLEADLQKVLNWAEREDRRWAISLANAGATYAEFRAQREELDLLDWSAIRANDFRSPETKERKQAEFLVHDELPWDFVERVGVRSGRIRDQVQIVLDAVAEPPILELRPDWYF